MSARYRKAARLLRKAASILEEASDESLEVYVDAGIPRDEAREWWEARFSPEEAEEWMEAGFEDPEEAARWRDRGYSPERAVRRKRGAARVTPPLRMSLGMMRVVAAYSMNVKTVPVEQAREYARREFAKAGLNLDELLPNFDRNYKALQSALGYSLGVKRGEMPVIDPGEHMQEFEQRLRSGHIDIFPPYAAGKLVAPKELPAVIGEEPVTWLELGVLDGDPHDDVVRGRWYARSAGTLFPIQSEIWLEKLVDGLVRHFSTRGKGAEEQVAEGTTIITSKEGYILDGHHRYGMSMLVDPAIGMKVLEIPLDVETLLHIGKGYTEAKGVPYRATRRARYCRGGNAYER